MHLCDSLLCLPLLGQGPAPQDSPPRPKEGKPLLATERNKCFGPFLRSPPLPAASFLSEKILKGSAYGSSRPRVDLPRLIDLYMRKKLKLDELVTRTYALDDVNEAMTALEKGEVVRSVVVM